MPLYTGNTKESRHRKKMQIKTFILVKCLVVQVFQSKQEQPSVLTGKKVLLLSCPNNPTYKVNVMILKCYTKLQVPMPNHSPACAFTQWE